MKKIEIMGCGYIGLPTAITFTLAGYEVCGFDVKPSVVESLNHGKIHIVEPNLQQAMDEAMATGRLHFTTKPEPADVFIIAVQTPHRDTPEGKRVSDMSLCPLGGKRGGQRGPGGKSGGAGIHLAPILHPYGGAGGLRDQRTGAGEVYDGPLPGADHSGPDAH